VSDLLLSDVIEAEFRAPQERRPELDLEIIGEESRIAMFRVLQDIQAGSTVVAWPGEGKIKIGSHDALSSRFARKSLHSGLSPSKIKRVFIEEVNRAEYPVPAEFYFSQRTLDLVRRGFVLRASSLESLFEDKNAEVLDASDVQISSFIRERLLLTFGGMADVLVQYRKLKAILANEGRFIDAVDIPLQSRIPNVPKDFGALSNSICGDIVRYLKAGGRIEPSWGRLEMDGTRVVLVATGTPVSPPKPVGRAKLIE
jgi:hypothetical protein